MAKKKQSPRRKPIRDARGRFMGVKGMTPAEVEAWRRQEMRERAAENKVRDEALRRKGKPGRPKGQARLEREAAGQLRQEEIARMTGERYRRSRSSKQQKYKLPPKAKRGAVVEKRKTTRGGVEKRVFRSVGAASWPDALKALRELPKGFSAWVQVGTGYGPRAKWVGSRLTSPAEAAHWLRGIGQDYSRKMFAGRRERLWTEVIAYRKAPAKKGKKK